MKQNETFYKGTQQMLRDIYERMELKDYQDQANEMLKRLKKLPKTALELGAGIGLSAINMAEHGIQVTALDFEETVHQLALKNKEKYESDVHFIQADFYDYQPGKTFELVCYLDGFGIGDDTDQLRLLKNIREWLDQKGQVYIEVYHPNHWRKAHGHEMRLTPELSRRYTFDDQKNAMVDEWRNEKTGKKYVQTLRCYSPEAFEHLAAQADLFVQDIFPNGKMDYDQMIYHPHAEIDEAMTYGALLVPKTQ